MTDDLEPEELDAAEAVEEADVDDVDDVAEATEADDELEGVAIEGAVDDDPEEPASPEVIAEAIAHAPRRRSGFGRLYHGETRIDFVGRWKLWFAISGAFILIGCAALFARGLNLGIDFTGGTVWEVPAGKANVADVEAAVRDLGYDDVQVQEVTQASGSGSGTRLLRVEAEATATPAAATTKAIDQAQSSLATLIKGTKGSAKAKLEPVAANLDSVEGPFATPVPAPLKDLQEQIDATSKALDKAKEANQASVASQGAKAMQADIDALLDLQKAQREKVGQSVSVALAKQTGSKVSQVTVDTVGPSWGKQISSKARTALVVFLIAIMIYITLRFEFRMALATIIALFHDLLVVVGVYAIFQFPVTPATVIAILTILGFSIYDGIVVFDRIDENTRLVGRKNRMTYSDMANLSLNEVLMRSLNTSITALLPILTVLILGSVVLGATTLEEFGLALFIGLMSGAYSSIFIATPALALLKEREPKYREVRARLAGKATDGADGGEGKVAVGVGAGADDVVPRPRKQGKKR
ncbi:MAG: protein translocase subunit SecF [Acidimicrobiales bacterium]